MVTKDTNKSKVSTKSKILVLGLMLIILAGLFSPVIKVEAQSPDGAGTCYDRFHNQTTFTQAQCTPTINGGPGIWVPTGTTPPWMTTGTCYDTSNQPTTLSQEQCGLNSGYRWVPTGTTTPSTPITAYDQCIRNGGTPQTCSQVSGETGSCVDPTTGTTTQTTQTNCPQGSTWTGDSKKQKEPSIWGSCSLWPTSFSLNQCIVAGAYLLFLQLPAFILYGTAYIFNEMLALTLGTVLYDNNFLPEAWRIVRDFSNIFFILVLLYISIKMILGLGGAEIKKMIVNVVIAALLINFSMFMTKVVIDSSNILALIFYNKITINVENSNPIGGSGAYTNSTFQTSIKPVDGAVPPKDIAMGIATAFNPTKFVNIQTQKDLRNMLENTGPSTGTQVAVTATGCAGGAAIGAAATSWSGPGAIGGAAIGCAISYLLTDIGSENVLPPGIALAIIFTSCAVFLFASYAFLIAAFAFIGRLIELWVLIIFSPFAFMSLSIPQLEGIKFLGFKDWSERLIKTAFMAPIFMFFLLLISKLIQIDILAKVGQFGNKSIFQFLMILTIPAIIYLTLLYKAVGYAKEGSGEFGKAVIKYGTMATAAVGGLALGAATGGASMALSGTIGKAGSAISKNRGLIDAENKGGVGGFLAGRLRDIGGFAGKSSFDVRGVKIGGKTLASAAGMNLGEAKGGFEQRKKERDEKRRKRLEGMKVNENDTLKMELNKIEEDLQEVRGAVLEDVEAIDKIIENKRQAAADAERDFKAGTITNTDLARANSELTAAKDTKKELRAGRGYSYTDSAGTVVTKTGTGRDLGTLEQQEKDKKQEINKKNRDVAKIFAKGLRQPGIVLRTARYLGAPVTGDSAHQRDITAHAIIMDTKLPDNVAKA